MSCSIIKGLFEADMGVGIVLSVLELAVIVYSISKIMRKKKGIKNPATSQRD